MSKRAERECPEWVAVEIGPRKRLLVVYTPAETLARSEEEKRSQNDKLYPNPICQISLSFAVVQL